MTTLIIAGNHRQYDNWIAEKRYYGGFSFRIGDYQYVSSSDRLRGRSDPKGVFIGTWYERSDIREILTMLLAMTRKDNDGILRAIKIYGEYVNGRQ